jgi:lysophospholipase L1-like esterase
MAQIPNIISRENYTDQQTIPPNNTANGWGYWESLDVAPSAEIYGVGPAWIGGGLYWSNGQTWLPLSNHVSLQAPKNYDICSLGDSLAYAGMGTVGTSTNSITVTNGVCYFDNASAVDLGVGQSFFIDWTADENLNMRRCVVIDQVTRNIIRFVVDGYTPPDGVITKSASTNITISFDQTYRTIQGVVDWMNWYLGGAFSIKFHISRNGYLVSELYNKIQVRLKDIAKCGWAYVYIGTNSISATDAYGSLQSVWDQMESIYEILLRNGLNLIIPTLPPANQTAWISTDGRRPRALWINHKIRQFAQANQSRVLLADVNRILASPSTVYGEYTSGTTTVDGLHIAPKGAAIVGKSLAQSIAPLLANKTIQNSLCPSLGAASGFDTLPDLNTAGFSSFVRNMLDNPILSGTGGTSGTGITGSTPDGWSTSRTGSLTATISLAAASTTYTNELTAVITSTADTETFTLTQTVNSAISGYAGRKVRVGVTLDISSATALKEVLLTFTQDMAGSTSGTVAPAARIGANNQSTSTGGLFDLAIGKISYVSEPFVLQVPSGNTVFKVQAQFWATGGATVKISSPFVVLAD